MALEHPKPWLGDIGDTEEDHDPDPDRIFEQEREGRMEAER